VRAILLAADPVYHAEAEASDRAVLARYGLTPGYVLYLGGFDQRKNLETVAAVMARVRQGLAEDAPLVIAGRLPAQDTPFAPDPRRLVQEAGLLLEDVNFLGMVPEADKPALYRGARVFLYPSRYEGFGLPALEALACGTPVVGSRASSIPEVVGAGGVLTDPDDVAGMAGAVLHLLVDGAFYTELRREGLAQANRFSWEATARATWEVYQAVLGH
jgi:alpha-1,3-rhamnosyl/mannosyltransferase